jgi:5-methyltetrahydropteroyltriglutamate--homocysteine methyltransferase
MDLPPIAATTVGSFPRPSWLATREGNDTIFNLAGELLREAQDDATALVIREQEMLGLDLVTDGEQRRTTFINHILAGFEGIDLENRKPKDIRRRPGRQRLVPTVVGKVQRRGPILADEVRFARGHAERPLKLAVPGPLTVIDTTVDEAYGDEAALAMDVAAALNAELHDLQAAGCDVIQIDEPAMTRYHEKVAAFGAAALDRCLEGIATPTIVHLCYGYPGTGDPQHEYEYPELLAQLMETRIGGFSVEFARSGYDPALLEGCRGRLVMFGCVDPGDTPPEPLGLVVERIRGALRHVEPDHLLIAPDCGLVTISRELARAKAALLVAAAGEARRTL